MVGTSQNGPPKEAQDDDHDTGHGVRHTDSSQGTQVGRHKVRSAKSLTPDVVPPPLCASVTGHSPACRVRVPLPPTPRTPGRSPIVLGSALPLSPSSLSLIPHLPKSSSPPLFPAIDSTTAVPPPARLQGCMHEPCTTYTGGTVSMPHAPSTRLRVLLASPHGKTTPCVSTRENNALRPRRGTCCC